jgi:hypothetical protein
MQAVKWCLHRRFRELDATGVEWSGNYVKVLYIERNTGASEEIQWIDNFHISLKLLLPPTPTPSHFFIFLQSYPAATLFIEMLYSLSKIPMMVHHISSKLSCGKNILCLQLNLDDFGSSLILKIKFSNILMTQRSTSLSYDPQRYFRQIMITNDSLL